MAQRPIKPKRPDLVKPLTEALRGVPSRDIQVLDEPIAGSRYRHITVTWDAWLGVPHPERSQMILDAFEAAHPDEKWRVLEITLALGFTVDEARKLRRKTA